MHKNYFGAERQQLFDWLTQKWMAKGAVACFIEGFPGVGKTDMAAELSAHAESTRGWVSIYVEVLDEAVPSLINALHEVADLLASRGKPAMLEAFTQENPNPAYALEQALREQVLIVIDEAGRLLGNNGKATSELFGVFSYLRSRLFLPGRVLLLSDRVIERDRWSEVFPIKPLNAPSISEAVELLIDRLKTSGNSDAVPLERTTDLVRVLGQNPRAIETFAAALTFESLDELIGHEPSMWEVDDRAMSPEFLKALERSLLERTLSHMEPLELKRLSMLAVHRKSFDAAAFESVTSGARKEWRELRHNLLHKFLVSLRLKWHALNPVVREISLSRLRDNRSEFKTAHSLAADYHMRHFQARNIVLDHQNLTNSYAELQYHLFHAERTQELRNIAVRLCEHLISIWTANSPVPQDRAELDERIGVLSALLQDSGPKSLEYYFARCLKTRGGAKDLEEALIHISRAIDENSQAGAWMLLAQLQFDSGLPELALQTCINAVRVVSLNDGISALYIFGARIFVKQGEIDEAVKFLRSGILIVPPSNSLASLYCVAAELLVDTGEKDKAFELLREGIKLVPADKGLSSLYYAAAEILVQQDQEEAALKLLNEGIKVIPADKDLVTLYRANAVLLGKMGKTEKALELLKEGIKVIPFDKHIASLYQVATDLLVQTEQGEAALEMLREGVKINPADKELFTLYQLTAELLITGFSASTQFIPPAVPSELMPDASGVASGLPTSLLTIARMKTDDVTTELEPVLLMATEWKSIHGGLSTFNRKLCRTLALKGHVVVCAVPSATAEEITDAKRDGVELIVVNALPGSEPLSGLYRPLPLPAGFIPKVVIGHGRITGAAAKAQSNDNFPGARRVHFVHMAPGEIEWFKEGENPATLGESRENIERDLAADADLVVAVGPRLRREFSDLLRGTGIQKIVHEFVPGPESVSVSEPPELNHCLVLGRAEDYELKGLDIAARALAKVVASMSFIGTKPELIVRGAKPGTSAVLRERLKKECDGIDLAIRVREYNSSEATIESDLRRAALLLMPSRREGFGLVAIEALSNGVPVLVSDTSGFGEVLQSQAQQVHSRNAVVTTPEEVNAAAQNWASAIAMQLLDRAASFSRAAELGKHLAQTIGWDAAVQSLMDKLGRH